MFQISDWRRGEFVSLCSALLFPDCDGSKHSTCQGLAGAVLRLQRLYVIINTITHEYADSHQCL